MTIANKAVAPMSKTEISQVIQLGVVLNKTGLLVPEMHQGIPNRFKGNGC